MVPLIAASLLSGPSFAKPVPWALNFAAKSDICTAGDLNADGYDDLIRISPGGETFIDVAINGHGMKSLVPQRALSNWGKDCQAACFGDFMNGPGVAGLFDGDTVRIADGVKEGALKVEPL